MIAVPLWQQAIDFLREKYQMNITSVAECAGTYHWVIIYPVNKSNIEQELERSEGESYYEAREKAILKAIELIN